MNLNKFSQAKSEFSHIVWMVRNHIQWYCWRTFCQQIHFTKSAIRMKGWERQWTILTSNAKYGDTLHPHATEQYVHQTILYRTQIDVIRRAVDSVKILIRDRAKWIWTEYMHAWIHELNTWIKQNWKSIWWTLLSCYATYGPCLFTKCSPNWSP